jgi:hypothetical protein
MKKLIEPAAPVASAVPGWRRSGRMIRKLLGLTVVTMVVVTTLTLASTSDGGTTKGNGFSSAASMYADGTEVAFDASATNLDYPGDTDLNTDVSVKDLVTGNITLA